MLHAGEQVGVLLGEEPGAEVAAGLLVAEHGQDHVAARLQLAAGRAQERVEEHRDAGLHVERPASPDGAFDQVGREGGMRPTLPRRRDHVDVPVQQQRRRLARARQACDEVRARLVPRDELRVDSRVRQQPLHVGDALALVPGRVGRVEADQVA